LLFSATSNAGGLFSGCYSSGFGTHSWRSDTEAYISRVEADGGVVINEQMVNDTYQFLADNSLTSMVWVDANFGVKKDGSNYVSKLYDLSDNDYDFTQSSAGTYPVWTANQQNGLATIYFDGTNDFLLQSTIGKQDSFTASAVAKLSDSANARTLWGSRTATSGSQWTFAYTFGGGAACAYGSISEQSGALVTSGYTANDIVTTSSYHLRSDRYATGATTLYLYINGSSKSLTYGQTAADANTGADKYFVLGTWGNGGVSYFQGYIGSYVLFSSSLSDANRGYVESFLNTKYAIY